MLPALIARFLIKIHPFINKLVLETGLLWQDHIKGTVWDLSPHPRDIWNGYHEIAAAQTLSHFAQNLHLPTEKTTTIYDHMLYMSQNSLLMSSLLKGVNWFRLSTDTLKGKENVPMHQSITPSLQIINGFEHKLSDRFPFW